MRLRFCPSSGLANVSAASKPGTLTTKTNPIEPRSCRGSLEWNERMAAFAQNVLAELERRQARPADVWKDEVAAARCVAADARYTVEPLHEIIPFALQVGGVVCQPWLHVTRQDGVSGALTHR